jgi:hypothetical protein
MEFHKQLYFAINELSAAKDVVLQQAFGHEQKIYRIAATYAINYRIPTSEQLDSLINLLLDKDVMVQQSARRSLIILGQGRIDYGPLPGVSEEMAVRSANMWTFYFNKKGWR